MTKRLQRLVVGLAVAAGSMVFAAPAAAGCPDGQTGVIYGCAPFCVEGRHLDTQTGLCVTDAPPPTARP